MHHNRRSIRLKEYVYSQEGAYFVTICTHERKCLFGNVENGKMELNGLGRMVEKCWNGIPEHFPQVKLDAFIVMPNHVHGILFIIHTVGAKDFSPLRSTRHPHGTSKTIGSIVRGFKIGVTKWIRNNNIFSPVQANNHSPIWQRNYYDHIIREENDLNRIREYIIHNPAKWEKDVYYAF